MTIIKNQDIDSDELYTNKKWRKNLVEFHFHKFERQSIQLKNQMIQFTHEGVHMHDICSN